MTVVPLPSSLSILIVPCMSSTNFLTIGIPKPVPITPDSLDVFCLEKFSKICGKYSLDIPIPVS